MENSETMPNTDLNDILNKSLLVWKYVDAPEPFKRRFPHREYESGSEKFFLMYVPPFNKDSWMWRMAAERVYTLDDGARLFIGRIPIEGTES